MSPIPWLKIVNFHREIIGLGAEKYFSLSMAGNQKDWSEITEALAHMNGPWRFESACLPNDGFIESCRNGRHEEWFLGVGCIDISVRGRTEVQPLFIREVELQADGPDHWNVVPIDARWVLSPVIYRLLDRLNIEISSPVDDLSSNLVERAVERSKRSDQPEEYYLVDVVREEFLEVSESLVDSSVGRVIFAKKEQWK